MNLTDIFADVVENSEGVISFTQGENGIQYDLCLEQLRLVVYCMITISSDGADVLGLWPLRPNSRKEEGFEHVVKFLNAVNSELENCELSFFQEGECVVLHSNISRITNFSWKNLKRQLNLAEKVLDSLNDVYDKYGKGLIYFSMGGTSVEVALAKCHEGV